MRPIGWGTFWGRHTPDGAGAPVGTRLFALLALAISVAALLGLPLAPLETRTGARLAANLGVDQQGLGLILLGMLASSALLLSVGAGAFSTSRFLVDRSSEALLAMLAFFGVAALDLYSAIGQWLSPDTVAALPAGWPSRIYLAVTLLVGGLVVSRAVSVEGRRTGIAITVSVSATAVVLLTLLPIGGWTQRAVSRFVPQPWELLPFALFAIAGLWIWPQRNRESRSILSHSLALTCLVQALAQVEIAFASFERLDTHFVVAGLQRCFGYAIPIVGAFTEVLETHRENRSTTQDLDTTTLRLRQRTRELARVDRELTDESRRRQVIERSLRVLEKAVETMSLGVTVTDSRGRILYVNRADAEMHGYEVEELLGESSRLFGKSEGLHRPFDFDRPAKAWLREGINVRNDGSRFPVRLISDLVFDDDGLPVAMVTICEDISERQRIERDLESRDRIMEAVGQVAESLLATPFWESKIAENLTMLREATRVRQVSLSRVESGVRKTWTAAEKGKVEIATEPANPRATPTKTSEIQVSDLPTQSRMRYEELGTTNIVTLPVLRSDRVLGSLRLEDNRQGHRWSDAELEALRTASRTLGAAWEREQNEKALAASQAQYRDILEGATDLIQSVDLDGRISLTNRSWRRTLGYDESDVDRLTIWDVLEESDHQRFRDLVDRLEEPSSAAEIEVVFVSRSGRHITAEGNVNGQFENGELVATRGIFRDISERKIVDRMKQEFVATVSHELRTPLTSIIAALSLLRSGKVDERSARQLELLTIAHRNSNRLLQLINDLLDLQKIVAGKLAFQLEATSARECARDAVEEIRELTEWFKTPIDLGDGLEGWQVLADRSRLVQVLTNLLSNAVKFSPEGAPVRIEAHGDGDFLLIDVVDEGRGIPEDQLNRIFEKFTQVDSSATRVSGGSGLGLSIAKGLVEGMGGTIAVRSRVREGSTFTVRLPLYRERA